MKVLLYNATHSEDMPNIAFVPLAFILLEEYLHLHANDVKVTRYDHIINAPESSEIDNYRGYDIVGFQLTFANINFIIDLVKKMARRPYTSVYCLRRSFVQRYIC